MVFTNLTPGIWNDETSSLTGASPKLSLIETILYPYLDNDSHPFLYFFLLKQWMSIFGYSEISARLFGPSILIMCTILNWYIIDNRKIFFTFHSLVFTSYFVIYFALEIRPYSLLLASSLIVAGFLWRLSTAPTTFSKKNHIWFSLSLFVFANANVYGFIGAISLLTIIIPVYWHYLKMQFLWKNLVLMCITGFGYLFLFFLQ